MILLARGEAFFKFIIFLLVKAYNRFRREPLKEQPAPLPTPTETLLAEIRDLLKAR